MYNTFWELRGNSYEINFVNFTCEVNGVNNYTIEGKYELKFLLNMLVRTADYFGIDVPGEVNNFLYR